jgi:hypothetical protein
MAFLYCISEKTLYYVPVIDMKEAIERFALMRVNVGTRVSENFFFNVY